MLTSAALVIDVVWPDLDSALPPGGLLFAKYLTRVGEKSIRVGPNLCYRPLQRKNLDASGWFDSLMTFTLPETLWLVVRGFSNLLFAYPTLDRATLRECDGITANDSHWAPIACSKCSPLHTPERVRAGGGDRATADAHAGGE
ncbi:hypothetical protein A8144_07140 [Mycobacterium leprae 3125609]|nr:hypothetical protein A8144_07140 [Mycobacterium leprae 3125609]OAX71318.1 hypothetical protein A3216_06350 [Mycobacterium leprae 7935681]